MKLRVMSDLHCEFEPIHLPERDDDHETVLIIAGDFWNGVRGLTYLIDYAAARFKCVVRVSGNHEYYAHNYQEVRARWKEITEQTPSIISLDNNFVTVDDVTFFGGTMWTSFNHENPNDIIIARAVMNDFRHIKIWRPDEEMEGILVPEDVLTEHHDFVRKLKCIRGFVSGKLVVVTHHLPTYMSVLPKWKEERANSAYAEELYDTIVDVKPNLWVHGHTHDSHDYMIDNTRIVCNPRGYAHDPRTTNKDFNPELVVEV